MNRGIIVAILSILFYLSNLLGGQGPAVTTNPVPEQQSYLVLGQIAQIAAENVIVRQGPDSNDNPVATVSKGTEVTVLAREGDWYQIRYGVGSDGWIPTYLLEFLPDAARVSELQKNKIILAYFALDSFAYESLLENGEFLTGLAPVGWHLDSYGNLTTSFNPELLGKNLYFAGNQELETYALIRLDSNPTKLLNNDYLQEKTASAILESVTEWGLKGIQLDLNYLPQDEEKLDGFLEKLKTIFVPEGLKILVAVPTSTASEKAVTVSYQELSTNADYLILKSDINKEFPGPLAAPAFVEDALHTALEQIPKEKLILGITIGGYDWARMGTPAKLSYQEIMHLAAQQGVSIKWDGESRSPFFHYGAGHEVWFENRYSLKYKLELVENHDLAGVALLNLGQEDPEIWGALGALHQSASNSLTVTH